MFTQLNELNLTQFFFAPSILEGDLKSLNLSFFDSGKKVRGTLVLLFGNLLKLDLEKLKTFARVAEMVHNSTLVHDDVIDLSSSRRGLPTINEALGNKKAVLTGDYLLSRSMYELSIEGNLDVVKDMSITLKDLVEGEWLQMSPPTLPNLTREFLIEISKRKTSSLLRWCCLAPMRVANLQAESLKAAEEFADYLGIGYQMTDDVLDFSEGSKKTFSLDLKNGLPNYVIFEAYKLHPAMEKSLGNVMSMNDLDSETQSAIRKASETVSQLANVYMNKAIEKLEFIFEYESQKRELSEETLQLIRAYIIAIRDRSL